MPEPAENAFMRLIRKTDSFLGASDGSAVASSIEARLGFRIPEHYRVVLCSAAWIPFEYGGIEFFGSAHDDTDREDILCRLFLDEAFVSELVPRRLFHFARPDSGGYDPVCIQSTDATVGGDGPVVVLDHEDILCKRKVRVSRRILGSFEEFCQHARG